MPRERQAVLRRHRRGRVFHHPALGAWVLVGGRVGALAAHAGWVREFQRVERPVHDVAGHVAEGAAAEVVDAAPLEGRVALVVRTVGRRAQEEVPRQPLGHRLRALGPRLALRPPSGRPVGPRMHGAHLAHHAGADHRVALPAMLLRHALRAHLRDERRLRRRHLRQLPVLVRAVRQRLLAVDVLAAVQRLHRDRRVHVVGHAHHHGVEGIGHLRVHPAPVGERLRLREPRGDRRAVVLRAPQAQHVQVPAVDVAERHHLDRLVPGHLVQVAQAHAAAAHLRDAQLLVRPRRAPAQARYGGEGERRRKRRQHERSARDLHAGH